MLKFADEQMGSSAVIMVYLFLYVFYALCAMIKLKYSSEHPNVISRCFLKGYCTVVSPHWRNHISSCSSLSLKYVQCSNAHHPSRPPLMKYLMLQQFGYQTTQIFTEQHTLITELLKQIEIERHVLKLSIMLPAMQHWLLKLHKMLTLSAFVESFILVMPLRMHSMRTTELIVAVAKPLQNQ